MEVLTEFLDENGCSIKERMQFEIAMEELLVNIVNYAYEGKDGNIEISYQSRKNEDTIQMEVVVKDQGIPYNPLEKQDPDITLSAEEREIGGLGIYMAKNFLDSLQYQYLDGKNCLTLEKQFQLSPVEQMIYRYPQLTLTPEEGMSQNEAYLKMVRKGQFPEKLVNTYHVTSKDYLIEENTIAGTMQILYLDNREDFERFVQVLAYRCENKRIPNSMGAITISNLNNWRKIEVHKKEYLAAGNLDWSAEFKRFTREPKNYKDTLIILSGSDYSAVLASGAGYKKREWKKISIEIRTYHEMAHVVLKRKLTKTRNPILEEVVADAIGIYQALGEYSLTLAKKFLGIEQEEYRKGGRLENYLEAGQMIEDVRNVVEQKMVEIEEYLNHQSHENEDIFEILLKMYREIDL
jgi:anti-sigma regulatory factor (Ser/Thr protein kinase)